jgi:hypothetical protein
MNSISYKKISGQDNYQLRENDNSVIEITYKPETHNARVETNSERRVLIIEDEGLLRIKMAIKNEYGIRIGSLSYDNFSDTHGSVEIEDNKFRFIIQHEPAPEIHIYKGSRRNLIYSCELSFDVSNLKENKSYSTSSIITVAWYLYLKGVTVEKTVFSGANIF